VAGIALAWSPLVARGAAPLRVAGVALRDIDVPFAWQAWDLLHFAGSGGGLGRRPGAPRFAWQA